MGRGTPLARFIPVLIGAVAAAAACAAPTPVQLLTADTVPTATPVPPAATDAPDTSEPVDITMPDGATDGEPRPASDVDFTLEPPADSTTIVSPADFDTTVITGGGRAPSAGDDLVAAAVVDIEKWLDHTVTEVYGRTNRPLAGGVHAVHPDRRDPTPDCGGVATEFRDMLDYVALYCPVDDFVAYDASDIGLLGSLNNERGAMATAVVIAHEYGHVVQERIGVLNRPLPTIVLEQHADCLAGAWMGWTDPARSLLPGRDAVLTALVALIEVRDPVGIDPYSPGGHGTAFDRIGAFTHGYAGGAEACVPLVAEPLEVMPNTFGDLDDLARGGDAPYDCTGVTDPECRPAGQFLGDDLDEFWSLVIGTAVDFEVVTSAAPCADGTTVGIGVTACPDPGEVRIDESILRPVYATRGDFTLGYLLGRAWVELTVDSTDADAECLVGAWVGDLTLGRGRDPLRESTVATSPGDLDEAVDVIMSTSVDGVHALERIASLRRGVLGGLAACNS